VDIEVLHWPTDQQRVDDLRERGVPRLLVIDDDGPPPDAPDCLEDWIVPETPAREREMRQRALSRRAEMHGAVPVLDDDGLLHHHDKWVSLSPVEQSLAHAMLGRFGAVVSRDALADRAWPEGMPTRNALDVHVLRLRRRIEALGLEIRTVRSRGYVLQAVPANGNGH
jgi:DNA-binding response OmpR family regulator